MTNISPTLHSDCTGATLSLLPLERKNEMEVLVKMFTSKAFSCRKFYELRSILYGGVRNIKHRSSFGLSQWCAGYRGSVIQLSIDQKWIITELQLWSSNTLKKVLYTEQLFLKYQFSTNHMQQILLTTYYIPGTTRHWGHSSERQT